MYNFILIDEKTVFEFAYIFIFIFCYYKIKFILNYFSRISEFSCADQKNYLSHFSPLNTGLLNLKMIRLIQEKYQLINHKR